MKEKKTFKERMSKIYSGRGFYIALFLCVAVIGAASWAIVFSTQNSLTKVSLPDIDVSADLNEPQKNVFVFSEDYDYTPAPSVSTAGKSEVEDKNITSVEPEVESVTPNTPASGAISLVDDGKSEAVETLENVQDAPDVMPTLFIWPVNGSVDTPYAVSSLVYDLTMQDWRTHPGVDISAALGSTVSAVADGCVSSIENDPMFGTCVTIEHSGGISSVYRNLAATPTVNIGDNVSIGDTIGSVGDTAIAESGMGSHLHLEFLINGTSVDPTEYLTAG